MTPGTPQQLAGYMLIVNPVVCPTCNSRYPQGTRFCIVCQKDIPQEKK